MLIENGGKLQTPNSVTSKWGKILPNFLEKSGPKMPKIKPEISTQTTFETPCVDLQTFLTMTVLITLINVHLHFYNLFIYCYK